LLSYTGANAYRASDCPENTYGASGKVYGLVAAPCKPCPRNMMTDGLIRVNNSDACINPDGFGYASEGLCRCLVGRFSSASRKSPVADCYGIWDIAGAVGNLMLCWELGIFSSGNATWLPWQEPAAANLVSTP
jgi:hypothetical protein